MPSPPAVPLISMSTPSRSEPLGPADTAARGDWVRARLQYALEHDGLSVVYQPEIDVRDGRVTAVEALARWHDDELGPVSPQEFIAVAEGCQLIIPLGRMMFSRVLADLPALTERWPQIRVAVNFSLRELAEPDFQEWLHKRLSGTAARWRQHLELEVTETLFQQVTPALQLAMQSLRQMGLTLAIDDFGTGHSSLARLHTLPFDKIKLDRSFVQALDNPMVQAIIGAMAGLAVMFSRSLVVEGVETQQQLEHLARLGCRTVQGYLLSAPAPLEQLLARATSQQP